MNRNKILLSGMLFILLLSGGTACRMPGVDALKRDSLPGAFPSQAADTNTAARLSWRDFFTDPALQALIDTALRNNPDIRMVQQEIEVARNEARAAAGRRFPAVSGGAGIGTEKVGRYTSQGAGDASTDMTPGKPVPDVLPDYRFGLVSSWEVDLRGRLKNAKRAAVERFLSSTEGKNLIMSDLVAEVAATYYELQALDRRLAILQDAIRLQTQALEAVRVQKAAARATELAVQQFEAQVMDTRTEEADCRQQIALAENHMNLLLGRYPQAVPRSADAFMSRELPMIRAGIPSQLLINRPDIRQAEHDLQAARFDVRVARAEFYPEINITSGLGYQAFNTRYLLRSPESLAFSLAGDALAPLINRSAIRAEFNKASALQVRALVNYERTLLTGFAEVSNELLSLDKLQEINRLRSEQVEVLRKATETSYELFKAARADYLEVLTVQRDVLEKQLEQVENRKDLLTTGIRLYKALGGGWR